MEVQAKTLIINVFAHTRISY